MLLCEGKHLPPSLQEQLGTIGFLGALFEKLKGLDHILLINVPREDLEVFGDEPDLLLMVAFPAEVLGGVKDAQRDHGKPVEY